MKCNKRPVANWLRTGLNHNWLQDRKRLTIDRLCRFSPVLSRFPDLEDRSRSRSCQKWLKDRTRPDFQTLIRTNNFLKRYARGRRTMRLAVTLSGSQMMEHQKASNSEVFVRDSRGSRVSKKREPYFTASKQIGSEVS